MENKKNKKPSKNCYYEGKWMTRKQADKIAKEKGYAEVIDITPRRED